MPFIEESDLLDLHKDIDKAQIINERLLDQIKYKNKDLRKIKLQRNILLGFVGLFVIGTLAITSFTAGLSSKQSFDNQSNVLVSIDSLDVIKARIDNLRDQNEELSLVREFYLAKEFLNKEKIYSVQVKSFVEIARKEDGKVLTGGEFPENLGDEFKNGYFLRPTVIKDLTQCSEIHQTEIFGPVVTVNSFKYLHEGVKWANTSPYGLSASVWTKDLSKAHKMARDLKVGTVWVNTWLKRDLRMPFGGQKASGLGREGGEDSIDFFTEKKTVCIEF